MCCRLVSVQRLLVLMKFMFFGGRRQIVHVPGPCADLEPAFSWLTVLLCYMK